MGLRSWITIVSSREQLLETIDFAKNNAYGVSYVLQITSENAPFPKGTVIVAWSGDGDGSKEDLLAHVDIYWDDIILLDDFLDDNPSADWHGGENGPGKYGVFLTEEQCNTVEITNVPVSFYLSEFEEWGGGGTLCEKIETDDFYHEEHLLSQITGRTSPFYGSFYRICERLDDLNLGYNWNIENGKFVRNPDRDDNKSYVARFEVPQTIHSIMVTVRPDRYIRDKFYIIYSINIEKILKVQSWELTRALFEERLENWRKDTQELFGAFEIIIPWQADVIEVDTLGEPDDIETVDYLHICIDVTFKDFNKTINISDIQNNVNEIVGILDIVSKNREELLKIKAKQADTILNISFCAEIMYNELFNKTFSTATPVYAILDTWQKNRIAAGVDHLACMCICIPPVFPDAKEYDMVTIESDWNVEDLEFCYYFNIDVLYFDDEDKQEVLKKAFEKELMSNKKQLESILSVNDWLKHHSGKPDSDKKTGIRVSFGEFEDKLWFNLTPSSVDIYDLSKSMRAIDLLNNWRKIKDIVEKVLEKIEAKR